MPDFLFQNFFAVFLQINIDRMNEIENCKEQDGNKAFNPNGYDIVFENAKGCIVSKLQSLDKLKLALNLNVLFRLRASFLYK